MSMDDQEIAQMEIRVIRDVIEATEKRLQALGAHGPIAVPRSQIYARVLYEVLVSAQRSNFGQGFLINAAVLDSILDGTDVAGGINLFDRLLEMTITN